MKMWQSLERLFRGDVNRVVEEETMVHEADLDDVVYDTIVVAVRR